MTTVNSKKTSSQKKDKYNTVLEEQKVYQKFFESHIFKVLKIGGKEPFNLKNLLSVSNQYSTEKGRLTFLSLYQLNKETNSIWKIVHMPIADKMYSGAFIYSICCMCLLFSLFQLVKLIEWFHNRTVSNISETEIENYYGTLYGVLIII